MCSVWISGCTPAILTKVLCGFPQFLQTKYWGSTSIRPQLHLFKSFHCIIHLSSYHSTLYNLATDSVKKSHMHSNSVGYEVQNSKDDKEDTECKCGVGSFQHLLRDITFSFFYQMKHSLLNYCIYHNLIAQIIFGKWGGCVCSLGASVFGWDLRSCHIEY
jgi:hypothetical protein